MFVQDGFQELLRFVRDAIGALDEFNSKRKENPDSFRSGRGHWTILREAPSPPLTNLDFFAFHRCAKFHFSPSYQKKNPNLPSPSRSLPLSVVFNDLIRRGFLFLAHCV